jgi:hypothetical protein
VSEPSDSAISSPLGLYDHWIHLTAGLPGRVQPPSTGMPITLLRLPGSWHEIVVLQVLLMGLAGQAILD